MTRILYDQLKKQNTLVITHFPRRAILRTLKTKTASQMSQSTGPARGLFNSLIRVGFADRMSKIKVTHGVALKLL